MITESLLNHAKVKSTANPFPGLRSFEYHESDLFFGREGQSEEMVLKLNKTHFLAVVGTSGSGKSSLVRAGLWPTLRGDLMKSAGSAWRIVVMRPGNNPIANLAIALNYPVDLKSKGEEQERNPTVKTVQTEVMLRRGSRGLIQAVSEARLEPHESLLIVVDQFEELFRFERISKDEAYANEAAAFVKLLLEAKQQSDIYIVLTMRSDYLGECARFWDLPEAINEGQYLIPRMTHEQRREAITGPIGVRRASISPRLVDQLLIDMGESPQQLPILQHALMRIWENWRAKGDEDAPLDILHYQECGGLAETLSRHADEAYEELPDEGSRWIAEKLFKCLTEKGADVKETRRPTELGEICRIADASEAEVVAVIDIFRREGRCFLMPSERVPLTCDTAIDISHESLIANWQKLSKWVEEEAYSARFYRQLAEHAFTERQVELKDDYRLQQALEWRKRTRPNVAWASRHHVIFYDPHESSQKAKSERDEEIFQCVMALIDTSEKTRDRKKEAREQERQEKLKRAIRTIAIIGVSAIILSLALTTWYMWYLARAQSKMVNLLNYRTIMNRVQTAYEYEDFGEANQLLDSLPLSGQEDLRGFDWYYFWRMLHNERATLNGHSRKVSCVAISPDGKIVATGSEDHLVKLWDASTGKLLWDLKEHGEAISSVAFAPDGKTLATGSFDNTIRLWDTATGSEKGQRSFSSPVRSIAFDRNGLMAVGLDDESVKIVLKDGSARDLDKATSTEDKRPVLSVVFSQDGKKLVSKSPGKPVKLWDVSTWQKRELLNSEGGISVAFSPDGKTIAAGTQMGVVSLRDAESGKEITCLARGIDASKKLTRTCNNPGDDFYPDPPVLSLTFGDNDTLITGNANAAVRLWKISTREDILVLKGHSNEVSSVAFSPDGKTIVTGSADAKAKLWDISQQPQTIRLNEQDPKVTSIAFFPEKEDKGKEDKLLVGGRADGSIVLWDTDSRRELQRLTESAAEIRSVAVATDRTIASWSEDNKVRLWIPTTDGTYEYPSEKYIRIPPGSEVTSVAFSRDCKMLATGSADGTVKLWNTSTGVESAPLSSKHSRTVWSVAFSSDGKMLATASADHNIMLWDTRTGKNLRTLEGHSNEVLSVAFSPDDKLLASGSSDQTTKLWNVDEGKELATLIGHTNAAQFVAFSPDGKRLANHDSDGSVKLWDTIINQSEPERWQELAAFRSDKGGKIQSLAFSPDQKMIAIIRENDVELWLAATPEEVEAQRK